MTEFTENVIKIIKSIPKGMIMTYGSIAKTAGNPKSSRQVSRILSSMSKKYNLPWHRVINSQGKVSLKGEALLEQLSLLADEGVIFKNDVVDLSTYMYIYKIRG